MSIQGSGQQWACVRVFGWVRALSEFPLPYSIVQLCTYACSMASRGKHTAPELRLCSRPPCSRLLCLSPQTCRLLGPDAQLGVETVKPLHCLLALGLKVPASDYRVCEGAS